MKRLSCLLDFIGIKYHGALVPDSGLYINSLPGINLKKINSIADPDQRNFAGVWADVQENAIAKFAVEVTEKFRSRYKLKQVNRSVDLGKKFNPAKTTEAIAEYRGFTIETTFKNTYNLVYSNFQSISVAKLSLYIKEGFEGEILVKIADMDTGEELDTFTITNPVVGWNNVTVGKIYASRRIFIGYDATNVETYDTYINQFATGYFTTYIGSLYGSSYAEGLIRGAETVDGQFSNNPVYGSNGHGFTGAFSLVCTYDNFICNNRDTFAMALQYYEAAELLIELMASDRLNMYTTFDLESADTMLKYFQEQAGQTLGQLVDSIDLDKKDICIECNEPIRYVQNLP